MGRMKDWMMDMEEMAVDATLAGAESCEDVLVYVKTKMPIVDETYIKRLYKEWFLNGPDYGP